MHRIKLLFVSVVYLLVVFLSGCSDDPKGMSIIAFYADRTTCHTGEPVQLFLKLDNASATVSNHYAFIQGAGTISNAGMNAVITLTNAGYALIKVTSSTPDGSKVSEVVGIMGKNSSPQLISWTADRTTMVKGSKVYFTVLASDRDLDPLICRYTLSPNVGSISNSNMTAVYTAPTDWSGTVTVTLTVDDGGGGVITRSMDLTVEPSWVFIQTIYYDGNFLGGGPNFTACGDSIGNFYVYLFNRAEHTDGSPLHWSQDNGTNWTPLIGSSFMGLTGGGIIACDLNNIPYVLHGGGNTLGTQVTMLSNGEWIPRTPLLIIESNDILSYRKLDIGADDVILTGLVFFDGVSTEKTKCISIFSNGSWHTLPMLTGDNSLYECVRLPDSSIWLRHTYGGQELLLRWTGSSWINEVQPATGSLFIQKVNGQLWAAQGGAFYRHTGSGWVQEFVGNSGLLAIGADGAYHVYHQNISGYWGYTVRDGVTTWYRGGGLGSVVKFESIYSRGNPSVPYLIARNYHGDLIIICRAE